MDVGNLLKLERAFERDGIVNAASEEKKVLRADICLRQFVASLIVSENLLQLAGDAQ